MALGGRQAVKLSASFPELCTPCECVGWLAGAFATVLCFVLLLAVEALPWVVC